MGRRLRADVHAAMIRNISAPGRASAAEASRSTVIGLTARDRRALREYLKGCLPGFAADYAAAVDAEGRMVAKAPETAPLGPEERFPVWRGVRPGLSRDRGERPELSGARHPAAVSPGQRPPGLLILGFSLDEVEVYRGQILKFPRLRRDRRRFRPGRLLGPHDDDHQARRRAGEEGPHAPSIGEALRAGKARGRSRTRSTTAGKHPGFAQAAGERSRRPIPCPPLKAIAEEALRAKRLVSISWRSRGAASGSPSPSALTTP